MTGEALFALLGDLDQALVDGAEALPERRQTRGRFRPVLLAAAAACAVLAILTVTPGLFHAGRTTEDSMSGGNAGADMTSKPEDVNLQHPDAPGTSADDGATGDRAEDEGFFAVIVSLTPELTVAPAENSPLWGQAERVILTMTDRAPAAGGMPEELKPGETVWISCPLRTLIRRDGATLEAPTVYGIYRS